MFGLHASSILASEREMGLRSLRHSAKCPLHRSHWLCGAVSAVAPPAKFRVCFHWLGEHRFDFELDYVFFGAEFYTSRNDGGDSGTLTRCVRWGIDGASMGRRWGVDGAPADGATFTERRRGMRTVFCTREANV